MTPCVDSIGMQRVGKGWQWTNLKTSLLIALSRHAYPYALAYPRAHFSVLRLTAETTRSKQNHPPGAGANGPSVQY